MTAPRVGPDHAREIRVALDDARALCECLALEMAPRASARQALVLCPWHAERTPSCSVRVAKDGTIAVRCHACGASGDALSLIATVRGLDLRREFREVLREAAEIAHTAPPEPREDPRRSTLEPEGVSDETYARIWDHVLERCTPARTVAPAVAAYLSWRGGGHDLSADAEAIGLRGLPRDGRGLVASLLSTFERTDLERAGVLRPAHNAIDWPDWALLIPWRDRFGRIQCVQRRRIDDGQPKYRSPRGRSPRAPFALHLLPDSLRALGPDVEVILVEGALDCLARRAIARKRRESCAVLGVYSASSPEGGLALDLLQGRRVVLALDDDPAGDRACERLADVLSDVAAELVRERPPIGAKDWCATLMGGGAPW